MKSLFIVAEQFTPKGTVVDVREFGSGNINRTFLVTLDGAERKHVVLQRINTQVFRRPELVMRNMLVATGHIRTRLERTPFSKGRRWEVPSVLLTNDGRDHWVDAGGSFWRALSFIENAESFDTVRDSAHAEEAGYALGLFHTLLSDLPPGSLADTLEGFHITPQYLRHYDAVLAKHAPPDSVEAKYCLRFVGERSAWAHVLEQAKAQGALLLRPVHGDPKINNILMDRTTGQAVSMVDLDTIKPGLVHYDIGDALRSGCNPLGEEVQEWERTSFDINLCRAMLKGYLSEARTFLTAHDFVYLYDAIRLIAFELGLRFFTDYLEGNIYFRVKSPEHNLTRALVQFRLAESIEAQEKTIRSLIEGIR
ncbi:MAG: aminoglycoside phosphotransferase family protein [Nitrospirota bacterium]